MNTKNIIVQGLVALLLSSSAAAGEMENDLLDRYRTAYESGNGPKLVELVYSEGLVDAIRGKLQER